MENGIGLQEYTVKRLTYRSVVFLFWYLATTLGFVMLMFIRENFFALMDDFFFNFLSVAIIFVIPVCILLLIGWIGFISPTKKRIVRKVEVNSDMYVAPESTYLEKREKDYMLGLHRLSVIFLFVSSISIACLIVLYIMNYFHFGDDWILFAFSRLFLWTCFFCILFSGFYLVHFLSDKSDRIIRKAGNVDTEELSKKFTFSFRIYVAIFVVMISFLVCTCVLSIQEDGGDWIDIHPSLFQFLFVVSFCVIEILFSLLIRSVDTVICTTLGKKRFSNKVFICIMVLLFFNFCCYTFDFGSNAIRYTSALTEIEDLGISFDEETDDDSGLFFLTDDNRARLVYDSDDKHMDRMNPSMYAHYEIAVDRSLSKEEALKKIEREYAALHDGLKYTGCNRLAKEKPVLPREFVDDFLSTNDWNIIPDGSTCEFSSAITDYDTYEWTDKTGLSLSAAYIEYKKEGKYRYYADHYPDVFILNVETDFGNECFHADSTVRRNNCLSYHVFFEDPQYDCSRFDVLGDDLVYVLDRDDGVSRVVDDGTIAHFYILVDRTLPKKESLADIKKKYSELAAKCDCRKCAFPKEFTDKFLSTTWEEHLNPPIYQYPEYFEYDDPLDQNCEFAYERSQDEDYYGVGLGELDYLDFEVVKKR